MKECLQFSSEGDDWWCQLMANWSAAMLQQRGMMLYVAAAGSNCLTRSRGRTFAALCWFSLTVRRPSSTCRTATPTFELRFTLPQPSATWFLFSCSSGYVSAVSVGSRPSDHYFRSVCLSVCFLQSFSQPSLIQFRSN